MNGFRGGFSTILAVAMTAMPVVAQAGWLEWLRGEEDMPKTLILGEKSAAAVNDDDAIPPVISTPGVEPDHFAPSCAASPCTKGAPGSQSYFCDCESAPVWNATGGVLFLHRSRPGAQDVLTYGGAPIRSRDFGLGTAGGINFQLTKVLCDCDEFELRYFGIDSWNRSRSLTGGTITGTALGYASALPVSPLDLNYSSKLYSTEANVRHWLDESWAVVGGFRWIEMSEIATAVSPGTGTLAHISTNNHMYGMQMGVLWRKDWNCWSLLANGNAGIYGNYASAFASVPLAVDDGRFTNRHVAFAGDLAVTGVYRFSKHLAARAGYQLMWIDSVALAPEQTNNLNLAANTGNIDFGRAFYHGATVGFDVTW